ncbi:hypothetical protein UlMin_026603 [Ulmus minor]
MFDSTLDLITQTASSSLFVFCFCNLIIIMILFGSKPSSGFDQESHIPFSVVTNTSTDEKQSLNYTKHVCEEVANTEHKLDGEENKLDEEEKKIGEEEDELRRRVEEFIEKVNKEWKAELSRTSQKV